MSSRRRLGRTHRRRARMKLRNASKRDGGNGVRSHNKPRPNGRKIRVKG